MFFPNKKLPFRDVLKILAFLKQPKLDIIAVSVFVNIGCVSEAKNHITPLILNGDPVELKSPPGLFGKG